MSIPEALTDNLIQLFNWYCQSVKIFLHCEKVLVITAIKQNFVFPDFEYEPSLHFFELLRPARQAMMSRQPS